MAKVHWLTRLPIETILGSTICFGVALVALTLLRRRSAGLRALILLTAFAGIVIWMIFRLAEISVTAPILPPLATTVSTELRTENQRAASPREETRENRLSKPDVIESGGDEEMPPATPKPVDWIGLVTGLWAFGFVILSGRMVVAFVGLSRLKRNAQPPSPRGKIA